MRTNEPPTAREQDEMTREWDPRPRIADALERIADALEAFNRQTFERGELAVTTYDGDAAERKVAKARGADISPTGGADFKP